MTVGENIKRIRKEKGLTQKSLGERCGMYESQVRRYELGGANPKYETILKIATALGVDVWELIGWDAADVPGSKTYMAAEEKLHAIGYSIGHDEDNAALWIVYPDGILEVTEQQLLELDRQSDDFLRFQLEQLKQQNKRDFKPNK